MKEWAKMPSYWIRDSDSYPMRGLKWIGNSKSDNIAALMLYIVLVQNCNQEDAVGDKLAGTCSLTYTQLNSICGLSRAKISGGIKKLKKLDVISEIGIGRDNLYRIENYNNKSGWAKLPAKGLYDKGLNEVSVFHQFHLRSKNELNALKIYLLIVAFRTDSTNYAQLGYEKISEYSGMPRNDIRKALSFLINWGLVNIERKEGEMYSYNMYRLSYLEPYKHMGTLPSGLAETHPLKKFK